MNVKRRYPMAGEPNETTRPGPRYRVQFGTGEFDRLKKWSIAVYASTPQEAVAAALRADGRGARYGKWCRRFNAVVWPENGPHHPTGSPVCVLACNVSLEPIFTN